tara:strand:- start:376 stop:537 length:162 start_codon:yes stop_codon:yes gene_type:complete
MIFFVVFEIYLSILRQNVGGLHGGGGGLAATEGGIISIKQCVMFGQNIYLTSG